jgi:predicted transcriptional regulator
VEEKLNSTVEMLQQQLMEEQNARLEAEKIALATMMKSQEEIRQLKKSLKKAQQENEEFRRMAQSKKCPIL